MSDSEAAPAASNGGRAFSAFEWLVALRYLRARRADGFVSVIAGFSFLGIMLGVATLIVVTSVMNGFHRELMDKIIGINGHAFVQAVETPLDRLGPPSRRRRRKSAGRQARHSDGRGRGGHFLALRPVGHSGARHARAGSSCVCRGSRAISRAARSRASTRARASPSASVSRRRWALRVGDKVSLLVAKGAQTPFGIAPRIKAYPVSAIFSIGMSEFDNVFVYMPLSEAQLFFNKDNEATVVEALRRRSRGHGQLPRPARRRPSTRPMMLTDWRQRNKTFFDTLQVENNIMFIILTLIVLVAAFNIISGLTMLVKDKTQRHRHSAHDGRDARRGPARLSHHRRVDRRRRNDRAAFCSV